MRDELRKRRARKFKPMSNDPRVYEEWQANQIAFFAFGAIVLFILIVIFLARLPTYTTPTVPREVFGR